MSPSLPALVAARLFPRAAACHVARRHVASVADDANNAGNVAALERAVDGADIVSFDFFDTVAWRRITLHEVHKRTSDYADTTLRGDDGPLPAGLILHCRGRYQDAVKALGLRKSPIRDEVRLADVFDGALAPYIRDPLRRGEAVTALIEHELGTEATVLVVDAQMRAFIGRLRAAGKKVILTSDMYFEEPEIRRLLGRLGLIGCFDHVFVSATTGVTKSGGGMFRHIDEALNCDNLRRFHVGDNWNNDCVQPRAAGWSALHYFNRQNERRKLELEAFERFASPAEKSAPPAPAITLSKSTAHEAIAAAIVAFSRFVAETAMQGRYERVFFLTRDGTVFQPVCEAWVNASAQGAGTFRPQLSELSLSRRAGVVLNCPKLDRDDGDWERYIGSNVRWLSGTEPGLAAILRTFAIEREELGEFRGVPDDRDFGDIRRDPELWMALCAAISDRAARVRTYLEQRGLFRDQKSLLVDVGYSGTVGKALSEHIFWREASGEACEGRITLLLMASNRYYEGNLSRMHPRVTMEPGVILNGADWQQRALAANFSWLEPFVVDRSRGALRDFRSDGSGNMVPVFHDAAPSPSGIDARAELLRTSLDIIDRSGSKAVTAENARAGLLHHFLHASDTAVQALKGLSHHAGLADVRELEIFAPIRLHHAIADLGTCLYDDHWVQGSLRRSGLGFLIPVVNRVLGLVG